MVCCVSDHLIFDKLFNYFFLRTGEGGWGCPKRMCSNQRHKGKKNVTKTVVHNFIIQKNHELIGVALQQVLIIKYMILFLKLIYRQILT